MRNHSCQTHACSQAEAQHPSGLNTTLYSFRNTKRTETYSGSQPHPTSLPATVPACNRSPNSMLRLHLHFFSLIPEPMNFLTSCIVQPSVVSGGGNLRALFQLLGPCQCQFSGHLQSNCSAASPCFFGYLQK